MELVLKLVMNMIMGRWDFLLSQMMDKINANHNEKKATLNTSQERMEVGQQMIVKIRTNQAKMEDSQERMETTINAGQEKVEAT